MTTRHQSILKIETRDGKPVITMHRAELNVVLRSAAILARNEGMGGPGYIDERLDADAELIQKTFGDSQYVEITAAPSSFDEKLNKIFKEAETMSADDLRILRDELETLHIHVQEAEEDGE